MKRMHMHLSVQNLERSIAFYSHLFGSEPTVRKDDYAKWMLDDPRVNFAISVHEGAKTGIEHVGLQVETEAELSEVYGRIHDAGQPFLEEGKTTCCYAKSEKGWVADPDGVLWEAFLTTGEATVYGDRTQAVKAIEACFDATTPQEEGGPTKADRAPQTPCCG
ncbi:MAG: glyoxalase/bleomycin resistance/dioxygenase family protein [Alphaproteobacteria bacterium]|nr:glyoxalase/bleomycin resistance/dioxygenase family protein [Alphaproteobacteria bacterium]